jgi:hypothetical protein
MNAQFRNTKIILNLIVTTTLIYLAFSGHSVFILYGAPFLMLVYILGPLISSRLWNLNKKTPRRVVYFTFLIPTIIYTISFSIMTLAFNLVTPLQWNKYDFIMLLTFYFLYALPNVLQELIYGRKLIIKMKKNEE